MVNARSSVTRVQISLFIIKGILETYNTICVFRHRTRNEPYTEIDSYYVTENNCCAGWSGINCEIRKLTFFPIVSKVCATEFDYSRVQSAVMYCACFLLVHKGAKHACRLYIVLKYNKKYDININIFLNLLIIILRFYATNCGLSAWSRIDTTNV